LAQAIGSRTQQAVVSPLGEEALGPGCLMRSSGGSGPPSLRGSETSSSPPPGEDTSACAASCPLPRQAAELDGGRPQRSEQQRRTSSVLQFLVKLTDSDSGVRREATKALGQVAVTGDAEVIAGLLGRLADKSAVVRSGAVEALVQVSIGRGDEVVVGELVQRLEHCTWFVRQAAATALGRLASRGDARVVSGLTAMLGDEREGVVEAALEALGAVVRRGDARTVETLLARLEDGGSFLMMRNMARALAQVSERGDERVQSVLLSRLRDQHEEVRRAVIDALPQVAVPGDRLLLDTLVSELAPAAGNSDDSRAAAATLLGRVAGERDSGGRDVLAALLTRVTCAEENWLVRRAAIEALTQVSRRGDAEVVEALLPCVAHSDNGVRQAAVGALGVVAPRGNARVVDALLGVLDGGNQQLPFLRRAAVHALGHVANVGDGRVMPALLARLDDAHDSVREAAVEALAHVSEKGDDVVVETLLDDLLREFEDDGGPADQLPRQVDQPLIA